MIRLLTIALFALPSIASAQQADQVSIERQAAMVPWVARDREQAMNDRALCSADLVTMKRQLDEANKQIAVLQAASKHPDTPAPDR